MRRMIRRIGGIGLIITAAFGLAYWEYDGRERLLTDEVLVARMDIGKNTVVTADLFMPAGVMEEGRIRDALTPEDLGRLAGLRSRQYIPENSQISNQYFYKDDFHIEENESVFVIKPEWISMMSSSIRQGDRICICSTDGNQVIGTYRVAFVKDNTCREVKDTYDIEGKGAAAYAEKGTADGAAGFSPDLPASAEARKEILERTDATSVAEHIEIIATMEQYREILDWVSDESEAKIMIVQQCMEAQDEQ